MQTLREMVEEFYRLIYRKRKVLFLMGMFLYIPIIIICMLWVISPENNVFEPIIVLLGFIISILSILPIIISKIFPEVEVNYELIIRWGYRVSRPEKNLFILKSQNIEGFLKASIDEINLAIVFTNKSEKTIIVKDIALMYFDKDYKEKGIFLNSFGNISTLLPGESYSHVTPFLLFQKIINKKITKISIEINGINFDYIDKPRFIALENDLKNIIEEKIL